MVEYVNESQGIHNPMNIVPFINGYNKDWSCPSIFCARQLKNDHKSILS